MELMRPSLLLNVPLNSTLRDSSLKVRDEATFELASNTIWVTGNEPSTTAGKYQLEAVPIVTTSTPSSSAKLGGVGFVTMI